MNKYTVQYPAMDVHRTGCADLDKKRNISEQRVNGRANNVDEFVAQEVQAFNDDDMGYSAHDFHILPCARKDQ